MDGMVVVHSFKYLGISEVTWKPYTAIVFPTISPRFYVTRKKYISVLEIEN
jgi:hypothetical protein